MALMPFLVAGDPSLEMTAKILLELQQRGADFIELGIPYSDPLADGPIIQLSATRALKNGTSTIKVINLLESLKNKLQIPIILFTYFNPILKFGFSKFCQKASNANVAGIIIPDLPLEEAKQFSKVARKFNLDLILLVAPTTPFDRMKIICNQSRGFTYLVSVTGVTGERNKLEKRVKILINKFKEFSFNPVAVGFGISNSEHVKEIKKWGADGVIIGSAFVKRIYESEQDILIKEVGRFCMEMRLAADEITNL